VVNLSPDKPQVFREAYRVLKSGGRLALSDIVTDVPLPQEIRDSLAAWAGCTAGALDKRDYISQLEEAGFTKIELIPVYFDQQTVDEYVKVSDGGCGCGGSAKQVVISDGVKSSVIDLDESVDLGDKPVREVVFSAKITAYKL
jgi:cyclopropane fatty-acyl-phospholipid synthase-like methyltransferase